MRLVSNCISTFLLILLVSSPLLSQLGSSSLPSGSPGELMAESLHQAIGLEKIPDVQTLLHGDTIFIAVYDLISGSKEKTDKILSRELPNHIDKWAISSISDTTIKSKPESFYYLKMYIEKDDEEFIVNLVNQPNHEDFIDRGRLTLIYKLDDGVFKLIKLVRWYG